MGYYDEDSDDEYYSFYGRNNHRKPQPDPAPPQPDPPAHMSYYCEDNDGNKHDTYSDHTKPDHYSHEHDDHRFEHEAPEYKVAGEVHGQREIEHEELKYEGDQVYKHKGLKYKGGQVYEHEELECEGSETYEHEELVYGPEHGDTEQEYEDGIDERERLETRNNKVYEPGELKREPLKPYELKYGPECSDSDTHYGTLHDLWFGTGATSHGLQGIQVWVQCGKC
jgi:hypothetical protein